MTKDGGTTEEEGRRKPVPCAECLRLMAAYGKAVRLYKEAVATGTGAVKADAIRAAELTHKLRQACLEENQRFLEHWKSNHASLSVPS